MGLGAAAVRGGLGGGARVIQGSAGQCSARRNFTGSEVVRDEFIGGLENTDQVVFLISAWRVCR